MTVEQIRVAFERDRLDPLKDFSVVCRKELVVTEPGPHRYSPPSLDWEQGRGNQCASWPARCWMVKDEHRDGHCVNAMLRHYASPRKLAGQEGLGHETAQNHSRGCGL